MDILLNFFSCSGNDCVITIFSNVHTNFWIVRNVNKMNFEYYFLHYFILIREILLLKKLKAILVRECSINNTLQQYQYFEYFHDNSIIEIKSNYHKIQKFQ